MKVVVIVLLDKAGNEVLRQEGPREILNTSHLVLDGTHYAYSRFEHRANELLYRECHPPIVIVRKIK